MASDFKISVSQDTRDYQRSMQQIIQDGKSYAKINQDITKEQNKLSRSLQQQEKLYGKNSVEVKRQQEALQAYNKQNVLIDNSNQKNIVSGNGFGNMIGNNIKSINVYAAQIGAAVAAGKLLYEQLKDTQLIGDKIVNTQYSLSQGFGQLGNNLIGVRVNILDTMQAAYKLSEQLDNVQTGNKFADMFGAKYRSQLAEYDRQQAELFNEIEKARRNDDQVQTAMHMNRLRQIFDERTETIKMLNDVETRRLNTQKNAQEKGEQYFLTSIKSSEKDFINMGTTLEEALKVAFLGIGDSSDESIKDIYKKWDYMTQQVTGSIQRIGYNSDQLFKVWNDRDNILISQQDLQNIKIFDRLITQSQDKVHDAYISAKTAVWNTEQAIAGANKENENFEKWLERIGNRVEKTFNSKPFEKTLKTLVDLQNEQEQLGIKLSEQTDPYVIRQLGDELSKIETIIQSLTRSIETTPIAAPKINFNPLLTDLQGKIGEIKEQLTSGTISLVEYDSLIAKLKELEQQYNKIQDAQQQGINITSNGIDFDKEAEKLRSMQQANIEASQQEYQRGQQAQNQALQQQAQYYGLANSIGSLVEMQDFSQASVVKMVAQMLPQIQALVQAKNVETVQGTTSSGATQGGIPGAVQGLAVGLGLIGSVLAQAQKKPKFATGGVFTPSGNNLSMQGDRHLAWLNANERVLTSFQNQKLTNALNTGHFGNNQMSLEVRGTSMIGVINNTLNKNRQINYRYD